METGPMQTSEQLPSPRVVSGSRVVVGLFAFGILMTSILWLYWTLHMAPFFPLQKALAEAFPKSSPRVEGGRHKHSPPILRVVLQVPFKPDRGTEQTDSVVKRSVELALRYQDVSKYELLEVYLVHPVPEKAAERLKVEFKIADLTALHDP